MKATGHIPDPPQVVVADLGTRPLGSLIGRHAVAVQVVVDWSSRLDYVPDQGATSSCVGQALSTSLYLTAQSTGTPIVRPSRKAIYDIARLMAAPHRPVTDDGSMPTMAIQGARAYGLVADTRWPLGASNINELPPLDVFQHSLADKLGEYYRIPAGQGCAALVRQALVHGYCPIFAMPVDEAYEQYDGSSTYPGVTGAELGGHMQCAAGFGPGYILAVNSWGRAWGANGRARLVDDWFDSGFVTDILVPTVLPKEVT